MAVKIDTKKYRKEIVSSDYFINRFNLLADKLEGFLETLLEDKEFSDKVASALWTAYNKCDEIDYEKKELVVAYSIIHFLDRYNRFLKSYLKLIDHKFLPLSYKTIEILDVGTGAGSALFAISDIYSSIIHFGELTNNNSLKKIKFRIDYVEKSTGFRYWLHHFTEFANFPETFPLWKVPYHNGSFDDFEGIEFNIKRDYGNRLYVDKRRFNLVIFSNFLTKKENVLLWQNEIRNCFRFLRNKGKLIAIGGKGKKYQEVYIELDNNLLNYNFSNDLNIGKCKKLSVNQEHLQFKLDDEYGKRLKDFFRFVYSIFERNDSIRLMSPEVKYHFDNYIGEKVGTTKKWQMHIYDKYARLKWEKLRNQKL